MHWVGLRTSRRILSFGKWANDPWWHWSQTLRSSFWCFKSSQNKFWKWRVRVESRLSACSDQKRLISLSGLPKRAFNHGETRRSARKDFGWISSLTGSIHIKNEISFQSATKSLKSRRIGLTVWCCYLRSVLRSPNSRGFHIIWCKTALIHSKLSVYVSLWRRAWQNFQHSDHHINP